MFICEQWEIEAQLVDKILPVAPYVNYKRMQQDSVIDIIE